MREILPQLTDELKAFVPDPKKVAYEDAIHVRNYNELIRHVAKLSYVNKDHLLFFRGQNEDYRNKGGATTLYPSIYRGERVSKEESELRFARLDGASKRLREEVKNAGISGANDIRRRRYIQWSILQHYEVCQTPLLDVTHSLRVACSFAMLDSNNNTAYIYVLGLPFITNRISVNSEHDLVTIRLLSICPPDALRPYYQEGYVAGDDELIDPDASKSDFDFNRRLIAKFEFNPNSTYWKRRFESIDTNQLYPRNDKMQDLCKDIIEELDVGVQPGLLGRFLEVWTQLETWLLSYTRNMDIKAYTVREAISGIRRLETLSDKDIMSIDRIRKFRNLVVHKSSSIQVNEIINSISEMENILKRLNYPRRLNKLRDN